MPRAVASENSRLHHAVEGSARFFSPPESVGSGDTGSVELRPLTLYEVELLGFLLPAGAFPDVDVYRDQIPHARVSGVCGCGCPSIALSVTPQVRRARFHGDPLLPVEAEGAGRDFVQVLLFAPDGSLQYLELVCFDEPALTAFPSPLELRRVNRLTR